MREIQVAENKTLKLTNVLARKIDASELGNLGVILTQMQNFIKSHSAMPVGPVIQCVKFTSGPNPEPQIYFMMQVNQLIPRLEPGCEQDAVLRVKGCLYAHFTGPMDHSSLASQKLNIYAYEHEIELTGVCDLVREKAEAAAKKWNVPTSTRTCTRPLTTRRSTSSSTSRGRTSTTA